MPSPYDAIQVANKFIELGREDGITDLSNMKLQRLVFYAHSVMLCDYDRPLIKEDFRAWKHGPVVYELYTAIRDFCNERSLGKKRCFSENIQGKSDLIDDQEALEAISDTWEVCKNSSSHSLARMSRLPNSPWNTVYKSNGAHAIIPNEQIRDYMLRSSREPVA